MDRAGGIFIVIEGTDGSGKGTQFKKLTDRLVAEGYDVATFDFPQYELPSSYFVKEYLNGKYGDANAVGPYTGSLFYALDRFEAAPKIQQALADGKVVLANRYVGSNMAHQGTKFRHAEERRGYFIWLDNLEFEMLRSPRPTLSFVLRVPAETAQSLVDQKDARSYTDKKRDIHEADLNHLQKAVEVYDDMCQLFPKDFSRIDCTRGGQLLDIDTIHEIVWQKVQPMLPAARSKQPGTLQTNVPEPSSQPKPTPRVAAGSVQPQPTIATSDSNITTEITVSGLLSQILARADDAKLKAQPLSPTFFTGKNGQGKYHYYTPSSLNPNVREQYHAYMDEMFGLYTQLTNRLTAYLREMPAAHATQQATEQMPRSEQNAAREQKIAETVRQVVLPTLPVAATSRFTLRADNHALEQLILQLFSNQLSEARDVGSQILTEARRQTSKLFERTDKSDWGGNEIVRLATTYERIDKLAKTQLPEQYGSPTTPVRLTDIWPRNELDLIDTMLYEHSNLPLAEIRQHTTSWPYAKKLEVFETYLGESHSQRGQLGRAFDKALYTWDIICDYDTLRALTLSLPKVATSIMPQQLTPRYGYDVPQLIDDAGLTDMFEHCFDLSLRLYSLLQQHGYTTEAQYATLHGHNLRWGYSLNTRDMFTLRERVNVANHAGARRLLQRMLEKLAEAHPMVAESLSYEQATNDSSTVDLTTSTNYNIV